MRHQKAAWECRERFDTSAGIISSSDVIPQNLHDEANNGFNMSTHVSSFDTSMEADDGIDFLLLRKVAMLWAEEVEGITQGTA